MLRRVKIKAIPKARTGYQVNGSLMNDISVWGGGDYARQSGIPEPEVKESIGAVPREDANLEAEGGETAVVNTGSIPAFYKIQGPRHTEGGVPLNLPDESFIFSDTRSMKIKDPAVLKRFGLSPKQGGYTPAEISKKFGLNQYVKILRDPNSDNISKKTAELMIKNAVVKLGELALVQESKKGFEQGIPEIAKPALEAKGISPEDIMPPKPQEQAPQQDMPEQMPSGAPIATPEMMAQYGMEMGSFYPEFAYGGFFQDGGGQRALTQAELEERRKKAENIRKEKGTSCPPGYVKLADGTCAKGSITPGSASSTLGKAKPGTGAPNQAWRDTICNQLSKGVSPQELASQGHGTVAGLTSQFADCIKKGESATPGKEEVDFLQLEEPPGDSSMDTCTCVDPKTGKEVTRALMPGEECDCPDGSEGSTESGAMGMTPPRKRSGPWLQDVMDVTGAAIDQASINKYLPQRTDVDLVKPDLHTFDPTALYNQITGGKYFGEFAGDPRQASARQSQLAGQFAEQLATIGNQYNTMNQGAGQQHEYKVNDLENQERGMDAASEQQYLDRSAIARNQYDNSKRQARKITREAKKNLLTNMTKTDALNQLYPNYQVDPSMGGWVNYTPTDKQVDPGQAQKDAIAYAQQLEEAGLTPEMQTAIFQTMYGKRFGGTTFKNGGYVYSVFPIVTP
jgi:hypothetical protein